MESIEFDYEIVNIRVRPIADGLIKKYQELRHISAGDILFVLNHKSSGGKKKITLARTRKVPDKWRDILFQLGACSYSYSVEFISKTISCLDGNQMTALIYRELCMIGPEGEILPPDTNDWWRIIAGLGRNWFYPDSACPDLLDEHTDWATLLGKDYEAVKG